MTATQTFILTGATSGMGLHLAAELGRMPAARLIVGARNPASADALRPAVASDRLVVLPLDLASLASVRAFCASVERALDGSDRLAAIVCNAGLQLTGPINITSDGVEATFAANHLGHFLLVHELLPRMRATGLVTVTASGTHDPLDPLARRFGFRGGLFPSAQAVARGDLDAAVSPVQQGMDRYATSKLCNILFVSEMARRISEDRARFIAFDPGLMPGTGLARDRSALQRFGWTHVLPVLRAILPGVSSAPRSARAYAQLIIKEAGRFRSGSYVDFHVREITPSRDAQRADLAADLYRVSAVLTGINEAASAG